MVAMLPRPRLPPRPPLLLPPLVTARQAVATAQLPHSRQLQLRATRPRAAMVLLPLPPSRHSSGASRQHRLRHSPLPLPMAPLLATLPPSRQAMLLPACRIRGTEHQPSSSRDMALHLPSSSRVMALHLPSSSRDMAPHLQLLAAARGVALPLPAQPLVLAALWQHSLVITLALPSRQLRPAATVVAMAPRCRS